MKPIAIITIDENMSLKNMNKLNELSELLNGYSNFNKNNNSFTISFDKNYYKKNLDYIFKTLNRYLKDIDFISLIVKNEKKLIDLSYAKRIKILHIDKILENLNDFNRDTEFLKRCIETNDFTDPEEENDYVELHFKNLDISLELMLSIHDQIVTVSSIDSDYDFKIQSLYGTFPNECIESFCKEI